MKIKKDIEKETKSQKVRISTYGFYCAECGKFVYRGYDIRDKKGLPNNNAVCLECGKHYEDINE